MSLKTDMETIHYILSNMDDAVCMANKHGELLFANTAARKLLGIQEELLGGKKIWEFVPFVEKNDNLIQLLIEAVHRREPSRQVLVDFMNNDGELFQFRVCLKYSEAGNGRLVIIINDLTEFIKVTDAFTRYTSPRIADYVLNTPEGSQQGGQTREITVLMSDLRGFTAMSAAMPAQQLVDMLNHYFEKMVAVIDSFGGNVIEFLGDGIFVVFNSPNDDPKHAENAVACAIEMQNAMDGVNTWNLDHGYPALTMGIGIETGPAVVGNIGSSEKMKYGCVGEAVNMAGRLEHLTIGGQILISEHVSSLIPEPLSVLSTQEYMPKGGKEAFRIYDVVGLGENHRRRHIPDRIVWRETARPIPVRAHFLNDAKQVEQAAHEVWITALSSDGKYARLRPKEGFGLSGDLMIEFGGKQYGKIVGQEDGTSVFCFTVTSEGFSAWAESLGSSGVPQAEN